MSFPRQLWVGAALAAALSAGAPAFGQAPAGAAPIQWVKNFNTACDAAARMGRPVFAVVEDPRHTENAALLKKLFADPGVAMKLSAMVPYHENFGGTVTTKRKLNSAPHFYLFDPRGELIEELQPTADPARLIMALDAVLDKMEAKAIEALQPQLESKNANQAAGAVRILAGLRGSKSTAKLVEIAKDDLAADAARTAAVQALAIRGGAGAEEIVALLGHKSPSLRAAAADTLRKIGPVAGDAVIKGLEAELPDDRAAAYSVAASITRFPKGRDAKFWKSGSEEDRKALVGEWREWWTKSPNRPVVVKKLGE
jgi:hypothetical protein